MLFCCCSDLHIDFYTRKRAAGVASVDFAALKNAGSTVLVIAGDTANNYKTTEKLLKKALNYYEWVVWVDGNHEHYDTRRPLSLNEKRMQAISERHPRMVYLDGRKHLRLGKVAFVGVNGWYDWKVMCPEYSQAEQYEQWQKRNGGSNDAFLVTAGQSLADKARIQATTLAETVKQLDGDPEIEEIVVVTHTGPLRQCLEQRPMDGDWQKLNGSYVNTEFERVLDASRKIRVWVYGHQHYRQMFHRNGVTFVNNSRGYSSEQWYRSEFFLAQLDSSGQ